MQQASASQPAIWFMLETGNKLCCTCMRVWDERKKLFTKQQANKLLVVIGYCGGMQSKNQQRR